jgi:hypothetical protein
MPGSGMDPRTSYQQRRDAAAVELKALDARSALLANLRTLFFLAALVLAGITVFKPLPSWGWFAAGGSMAVYVLLARVHDRVVRREERARMRLSLNERGLARLDGGWHKFPERGDRFLDPAHLYAPDLDVFGQGSLFQLIDETATRAGEEQLAGWLSTPSPIDQVRARQGAVKELAPQLDFRQSLVIESRLAARAKADAGRFIAWAESPPLLDSVRWALPLAFALPLLTAALYFFEGQGPIPPAAYWAGIFLQLGVIGATRGAMARYWDLVSLGESGFVRFEGTFGVLESQRFEHPLLVKLRAGLDTSGPPVSARMHAFSRRYGFGELRQSGQFHAVINLLLLWDLHALFALERWRKVNGAHVRRWFEALAQVEATAALAGFAHDRPGYAFPELVDEGVRFEARAMGHPLLEKPVLNDVSLVGPGAGWLITGSNMSGKTTLLRAMGLNAVMAQAGMPVCAQSLKLSQLSVLTSMRVKDSLERGVSYFYAEVQRIKAVLDGAAAARGRALFLLDELLLGTNARERQIASREVLRLLLEQGAIGAVTTHDLALTESAGAGVRNVHFRDQLIDGKMAFDYQLREGVVDTTNALRVLALAGIALQH